MKLKYVANRSRKRTSGAALVALFLFLPFAATVGLNLSVIDPADVGAGLSKGNWALPIVLLIGLLICGYLRLTPKSYLLLDAQTRTATFFDGDEQRHFTLAALGPIRLRTTIPPGNRKARHYCVETDAVPVIFFVDSLREPAIKKARELCKFLDVPGEFVAGVHPGIPIDE